jgi:hypothetical protein
MNGEIKRLLLLILTSLLLAACSSTVTSDMKTTVQVITVATLTIQPTIIATPTLNATPILPEMPTLTPKPFPFVPPAPKATLSPRIISLATYKAHGFSFQYPANARLENIAPAPPAVNEIHIVGPDVWVKPGDADWDYNGPAYELIIRTYENPDKVDVESWTRTYILTSWQKAREQGFPWGSLPISEQGVIEEDKVGGTIVAGQSAFWVDYFAFDSDLSAFYLSNDNQIIELSFYDYPLANQPLATIQQDVYALTVSTFRLEK